MISSSTDPGNVRRFGLAALLLFGGLCALGIWGQRPAAGALFGVLASLGAGLLVMPVRLAAVHRVWLGATRLVGRGMTAVMLSVAYLLVITPSGLLKRVLSGSPLPRRPDREASSYWVKRGEPAQPTERFCKRY